MPPSSRSSAFGNNFAKAALQQGRFLLENLIVRAELVEVHVAQTAFRQAQDERWKEMGLSGNEAGLP